MRTSANLPSYLELYNHSPSHRHLRWGLALCTMLAFALLAVLPAAAQIVVYENDFEDPADPLSEWSTPSTDIPPMGARRFLGQFGPETVSLTLTDLPPHTSVAVSFDLFIIQSWDGNDLPSGPDIWDVSVASGPTLLHTTFSNFEVHRQAYPDTFPGGDHPAFTGAAEINTLGYTLAGDSVYRLSLTFPHSTSALALDFAGMGLQELEDESWGLDNVRVSITPATPVVVTNTNESGPGSLRQAIIEANASEETASVIIFNIPTADPGFDGQVFTIRSTSPLPVIERPTILDGTTQTAFSGDSNLLGPEVVLNGSEVESGSGITITGDGSGIIGLIINGFASGDGISLVFDPEGDLSPSRHQIRHNYLGTDPTGAVAVPNGGGVSIHGFGSPDFQAQANELVGNLISGNAGVGISLCDAADTRITDNRLGTDRAGTGDLGNGSHGILLTCAGAPKNQINQNTIAFNGGDGVRDAPDYHSDVALTPEGHQGNAIRRNAIFANDGLGINILPPPAGTEDDVTPNDACDADEGGNRLQNFPELTLAASDGRNTTLSGTLNSAPNQRFTVELFANEAADPSGFGEGQRFLEGVGAETDAACTGRFTLVLPATLTGQFLTATATDAAGNTSEFSAARPVLATMPSCQGGGTTHIRGQVTEEGTGLPGITVTFVRVDDACQQTTTTGRFGIYDFPNLGWGTYIVIPSQEGCSFSPPSWTVGVGEGGARMDFTGSCS